MSQNVAKCHKMSQNVTQKEGRKMTPRQAAFVEEYAKDYNATRSAARAGYSAKNAGKIGPRLTKKPHIAAAIRAAWLTRPACGRRRGTPPPAVGGSREMLTFVKVSCRKSGARKRLVADFRQQKRKHHRATRRCE